MKYISRIIIIPVIFIPLISICMLLLNDMAGNNRLKESVGENFLINQPAYGSEFPDLTSGEKAFLLKTARNSIINFLDGKKQEPPRINSTGKEELQRLKTVRNGIFVTLDKGGTVRGCRGTLEPARANIIDEVSHNAIAAAMGDSRFPPLRKGGIDHCRISITVVHRLIPIRTVVGIRKSEGLVLKKDENVGVVLPYEGSDPVTRLKWAYKKAGLPEPGIEEINDLTDVFVMKAERFADTDRDLKK